MSIEDFDGLLEAARSQPRPQRLLLVFATAELPPDATPQQRACFERGEGGALTPALCVHKTPDEIATFDALLAESASSGVDWAILFIAAISSESGGVPSSVDAEQPLRAMVDAVKRGRIQEFLAVDRTGELVDLSEG